MWGMHRNGQTVHGASRNVLDDTRICWVGTPGWGGGKELAGGRGRSH